MDPVYARADRRWQRRTTRTASALAMIVIGRAASPPGGRCGAVGADHVWRPRLLIAFIRTAQPSSGR